MEEEEEHRIMFTRVVNTTSARNSFYSPELRTYSINKIYYKFINCLYLFITFYKKKATVSNMSMWIFSWKELRYCSCKNCQQNKLLMLYSSFGKIFLVSTVNVMTMKTFSA